MSKNLLTGLQLEVQLAEIEMFRAHLANRARICYAMIAAGVICLGAGVAMLVVGLAGNQVIWPDSPKFKVTAGGFGAVTMLASVAWGFVAYRTPPTLDFNRRNTDDGSPTGDTGENTGSGITVAASASRN